MKQEKRHKLQLHYEILCAIDDSIINYRIVRPTNIQHISRLSYDKLINHLMDLEQKGMIHRDVENKRSITLTNKGKMFLKQYTKGEFVETESSQYKRVITLMHPMGKNGWIYPCSFVKALFEEINVEARITTTEVPTNF